MGTVSITSMLQCIIRRFVPKKESFFEHFDSLAFYIKEAAATLSELLSCPKNAFDLHAELKDIEGCADDQARMVFDKLSTTFVTPIDREDISLITSELDDVVDKIESVGRRMMLVAKHLGGSFDSLALLMPQTKKLVAVLVAATAELPGVLHALRKTERLGDLHKKIHASENSADRIWEGEGGILDLYIKHLVEKRGVISSDELLLSEWKNLCHAIEDAIDSVKNTVDKVSSVIEKFA